MQIIKESGWIYYLGNDINFDNEKVGKWMYFFNNGDFAAQICKDVIERGVVSESKHTDADEGVACFYLNYDDIAAQKRIITYFLENALIKKTKAGRFYNISFKLDNQTLSGEYGDKYNAQIKLSQFIDLDTGEWLDY